MMFKVILVMSHTSCRTGLVKRFILHVPLSIIKADFWETCPLVQNGSRQSCSRRMSDQRLGTDREGQEGKNDSGSQHRGSTAGKAKGRLEEQECGGVNEDWMPALWWPLKHRHHYPIYPSSTDFALI